MNNISVCIGCGCDDAHACKDAIDELPCAWLVVDRRLKRGVCSSCPVMMRAWNNGQRQLSEKARIALELRSLAKAERKRPTRCPGFRPPRPNPLTRRTR